MLWRDALAGCSALIEEACVRAWRGSCGLGALAGCLRGSCGLGALAGALPGCSDGVLCFHRRGLYARAWRGVGWCSGGVLGGCSSGALCALAVFWRCSGGALLAQKRPT